MADFTRTWFATDNGISEDHENVEVRQRYCFVFTSDKKVIVVAKADKKWQFPGGHPKGDELWQETLVREVREETGLEIKETVNSILKLGYYLIEEENGGKYLQERYMLVLANLGGNLNLQPEEEAGDKDKIEYVRAIPISEIEQYVPWALKVEGWNSAVEKFAETLLLNIFQNK